MQDYLIGCYSDTHYHTIQAKSLTAAKSKCSKFYCINFNSLLKVAIKEGDNITVLSSKRGYNKWVDKV